MVLAVGFLLIPATLLLAQLPGWVGTTTAAQAAAVEGARRVVLAADMAAGVADAEQTVQAVLANHGVPADDLAGVTVTAEPGGELRRGQVVTVTVRVRGKPIEVPGLGTVGNPFEAVGAASERVDDYRGFGP